MHVAPPEFNRLLDGERRHLTVLFCDLVNSSSYAEQLDPEDWNLVLSSYHDACAAVVRRFDGHVAELLGDGMVAYFGWPIAHENDAYRAIRAALGMLEAMEKLSAQVQREQGIGLRIRVGIDTGTAVIREMSDGRGEKRATGNVLNIAARIQGLAEPGTIVVSSTTFDLVRSYYTHEDLGLHTLRNIATPVHVYRVIAESDVRHRLEAVSERGLTPLVGRERELSTMLTLWERTVAGTSQIAYLTADPGIGKSRLVRDARQHIKNSIEFRCSPYDANSALFPVITRLQRLLQFDRITEPAARLDRLEQTLQRQQFNLPDAVPLMAALFSVPLLGRYPALTIPPASVRQQSLAILVEWLLREAEQEPLMAVWEDLHWADPSTLEFLGLLFARVQPQTPLFNLLTYRAGVFNPPWSTRVPPTEIALRRLERSDVESMVAKLTGGRQVPGEVLDRIVEKTDGVPLFVEEILQSLLDSGAMREDGARFVVARSTSPFVIPATLEDSLMSRLDRLGPAKGIAQLGSILGRTFTLDLIRAVLGEESADDAARAERWRHAEQSLTQLVDAGVLQLPRAARTTFEFKHALIRDAAYQSLLKRTRQSYHLRTAVVLETQFAEVVASQPELVARHYTEGAESGKALDYWQKAGELARGNSANVEATLHFAEGLRALEALPEDEGRERRELALRIASLTPLIAVKGYNTDDTADTLNRSLELGRKIGEVERLFPVLYGHWVNRLVGGRYEEALRLSEDFIREAARLTDPVPHLIGYRLRGFSRFVGGELAVARDALAASLRLYDPSAHVELKNQGYAQDPRCACEAFMALVRWLQGYPDEAATWSHDALEHARDASHSNTWGYTLCFGGVMFEVFRRDFVAAERLGATLIQFATDAKLPVWLAYARVMRGWARVQLAGTEEGLKEMKAGLVHFADPTAKNDGPPSMAMGFTKSFLLTLYAEAFGVVGRPEEGLEQVEAAWRFALERHEEFWKSEIQRLKGVLLLQIAARSRDESHRAEADACFTAARGIADGQGARALALRAATSASRLWQREDPARARRELEEVLATFTEGFFTRDLRDARQVLDELRGA